MSTDSQTTEEATVIKSGQVGEEGFIEKAGPIARRNGWIRV